MKESREIVRDLSDEAYALEKLGDAFRTIGNIDLADRMTFTAARLENLGDRIQKMVRDDLDTRLRQAETNSINVIKAAMAGTKLGNDHE